MVADLAVSLVRQGYRAIPLARRRHGGAGSFDVRMMGRRATVVRGADGTRLLYDPAVIRRRGAVPAALAGLLFGRGGVQGLDGARHADRKRLFLDILDAESVERLVADAARRLDERLPGAGPIPLYDLLVEAYGAAVLSWAGTGVTGARARRVSHELAKLVDGFGGAGLAYPRGWLARVRMNRFAAGLVRAVRNGTYDAPAGSALAAVAAATEGGEPLPARVAGVELVNILRPTVAVAWPGNDLARALAEHPDWRSRLREDPDPRVVEAFVHEVRRLYPLTPALAGKVRATTTWRGHTLTRGQRVVLDVPGTDRDPAVYADADAFRPERVLEGMPDEWQFVPQGGGRADEGHRCPGEPLTVRLLVETARRLAAVDYVLRPYRHQRELESCRRIPPPADEQLVVTGRLSVVRR